MNHQRLPIHRSAGNGSRFVRPIRVCLIWSLTAGVGAAVAGEAADPVDLLKTLAQRRAKVKTLDHVTETIIRRKGSIKTIKRHRLESRSGSQIRIRRTEHASVTGRGAAKAASESVFVCDGSTQWEQKSVAGTTFVIKSPCIVEQPLADVLALVGEAKMKTRARTKGRLHDMPCQVFDVVGVREGSPFKTTYWISEAHGLVLKSTEVDASGLKSETRTISVSVDRPIDPSSFAYSPPKGATIVDTGTFESKRKN